MIQLIKIKIWQYTSPVRVVEQLVNMHYKNDVSII